MRKTLLLAVLLGSVGAPAAHAQSANLSPRVDKLEKEMRAVQRKVFPGGSTQFLEPEIAAPVRDVDQAGSPASTPLADLSARVSALESQLQSLTGQIEQNSYKTRQLDEAFKAYKAEMDARLKVLEGGGEPVSTPGAVSGTGSVKPPVVIGDVSRPEPITVEWAKYAQSLTDKPVKGMLTGPVTILCWSFPREDVTRETIAKQIALLRSIRIGTA